MKTRIEKGITIITTGDPVGGQKNRTGFHGVSQYRNRYRADITHQGVKYTLGMFNDKQTAINARKVADNKKAEGVLTDFLEIRPHGNSDGYMDFWNACFKEYGLT